jgi:hypothetical protein
MLSAEWLRLDEAGTAGVPWLRWGPCLTAGRRTGGWPDLPGRSWQLTDVLSQNVFKRDGGELASSGLFVDLGPWQSHLLALQ